MEYKVGDMVMVPAMVVGKHEYRNGSVWFDIEPMNCEPDEDSSGIYTYQARNIIGQYKTEEA